MLRCCRNCVNDGCDRWVDAGYRQIAMQDRAGAL
jgi:hypothetical protein